MKRRSVCKLGASLSALALAVSLSGCAAPQASDYAKESPRLDLKTYFNGELVAHGVFTDRSGKVARSEDSTRACSSADTIRSVQP